MDGMMLMARPEHRRYSFMRVVFPKMPLTADAATVKSTAPDAIGFTPEDQSTAAARTYKVRLQGHDKRGVPALACQGSGMADACAANGVSQTMARILIVEDEPLIRMVSAEILREAGFVVDEAASAAEGMDIFNSQAETLDAAIIGTYVIDGDQVIGTALPLADLLK